MNPKKFGKIDNHRQEPRKAPLPIFIESLYFKRFGRERPDVVRTIEEAAAWQRAKKAARKEEAEQLSLAEIGVMLEIQRLETAGPYLYETAEPYAGDCAEPMWARWPNCGASRSCDGARAGRGFARIAFSGQERGGRAAQPRRDRGDARNPKTSRRPGRISTRRPNRTRGIAPNRMSATSPNCEASQSFDGARAGRGFTRGPAKYGASLLGRLRSKSTRRLDAKFENMRN